MFDTIWNFIIHHNTKYKRTEPHLFLFYIFFMTDYFTSKILNILYQKYFQKNYANEIIKKKVCKKNLEIIT